MLEKIRIAVVGYGNVGKGVEKSIIRNQGLYGDVNLAGILTRSPERVKKELEEIAIPVVDANSKEDIINQLGKIDVAILCGGSANDLPEQGPYFAHFFNTVDSFDTHAKLPPLFHRNLNQENF